MKNYCYHVKFHSGGIVEVFAGCKTHAIILAQAERIKAGLIYTDIKDVYTVD